MKHLQLIENEFINFLQTYSSVLSVSYDGTSEEVYELKKSKLETLAETVGSSKSETEKLRYVNKWIQYVQQRKAVDLLGTIPEYTAKLAERLNKKVVLQVEGGDVLVESKTLKPFFQVLPHFIRNSIDHGIEPASERGSKSETGVIKVAFSEDKAHWFVEISDDGRGINLDKLVKRALELKVISEEQLRKMSNEEKFNLIFLDGVSSSDQVSDISGRGVGMSAVADVIHGIGGEIKISSEIGSGTSIMCAISKNGRTSLKSAGKVAA
jgi:chemotaxis protein histidine kinase CheA